MDNLLTSIDPLTAFLGIALIVAVVFGPRILNLIESIKRSGRKEEHIESTLVELKKSVDNLKETQEKALLMRDVNYEKNAKEHADLERRITELDKKFDKLETRFEANESKHLVQHDDIIATLNRILERMK